VRGAISDGRPYRDSYQLAGPVSTGKCASSDRWIAGEKPTSRYQSGQLPPTPFLANFRFADHTSKIVDPLRID